MNSPFTNLESLATYLRSLVQTPAPIVLDKSILGLTVANALAIAFRVSSGFVKIDGVSVAHIPAPADNQLTISAGKASVLGQVAVPITLTFSIASSTLQITVASTMPSQWQFANSFPSLSLFPFDLLTVTNGAHFIFSSMEQPAYSWPGDSTMSIDLAAGQNFLGEVGLAGFPLIAALLDRTLSGTNFKIYGPFSPIPGQVLPVGLLTVPLAAGGFRIGSGADSLSLSGPAIAVGIGTSDDTNPFQHISLELQGTFQNTLQVAVAIPISGNNYSVTTTPLPNSSSITSLIEALPGGGEFTSYIPAELSAIFKEVGLDYFTMVVDSTPSVTYLGLEISTLKPWTVIPGVIELEKLRLVLDILEPSGLDLLMVRLDAQSRFLPGIFKGEFDFTVALEKSGQSWEVSTVGGSYFGAVNLGDLVAGLLPGSTNPVPPSLRDISFSNFGVSATRASQGSPFSYTAYGSVTAAFPLLDSQLTAGLNVVFRETATSYAIHLSGSLIIGDQAFDLTLDLGTVDAKLEGAWIDTGTPLGFAEVAGDLGWTGMPTLPSDLDLGLISAAFTYDFISGDLIFAGQSKNYGSVCFAALSVSGSYQFFFQLNVDQQFSLSNLPLVGKVLATIENIQVGQIEVLICSTIPSVIVVGTINQLIGQLNSSGKIVCPLFPTAPLTGTFLLQAQLAFGSETIPLNLQLGGASTGSQQALPAPQPTTALSAIPGAATGSGVQTSKQGSTTWFTVQKSFGPLSIQRIGALFQSGSQTLWFEIDASLALGPLTLSLSGLGVGAPLKSFDPQFSLQGLGIDYAQPPLIVAGTLINLAPPGAKDIAFEGGVTIGTGTFTLMAFGFYGKQDHFNSMFLFGDIAYDFGGPPAFFVTGLALGFGYNSNLRIPTIDQIATFPFVQVLPTSMLPSPSIFGANPVTPQEVLDAVMDTTPPWVKIQQGTLWFGAGITFTSFELINSQALVLVEIGPDLTLALIGTSRAQFPQAVAAEIPVYAYIELDLEVIFAPLQGVFSLQAMLASSSFLLDKSCVLTGGFAFFVWFGSNAHAGDFVLTLGGYNAGFTPPTYYPAVPRVGFHWSLDSSISITGGAYFAFTPSALMVGGELKATYQTGNLKAWFDAYADIIVQWKPFWFEARIGISIGASYKVDLLLTSYTVTAELGCNLQIWGPPTGGTVGVDWYIISFTIPFGSRKNSAKPVISQWSDVATMLPGGGATASSILTLAPSSGLTPGKTSPKEVQSAEVNARSGQVGRSATDPAPAAPWIVRGSSFGFSTSSSVPASSATLGAAHAFNGTNFNVAPLGWTGISASHTVTLTDASGKDFSAAFSVVPALHSLPAQLWGTQTTSTPSGDAQLIPGQLTGLSALVNTPAIGGSAGPVNVGVNLSSVDMDLHRALLGISGSAHPSGDVPVISSATIAAIGNPTTGIGSVPAAAARSSILAALQAAGYLPYTANDPMTIFAAQAGSALSAEPLLVS